MLHKYANQVSHFRLYHRPARSILTSAVIGLTLFALLLTFVGHLTLAWMNGQAATLVLGQPDFTTKTTGTTQTTLAIPFDVTVDPATGKVFVADVANNRVLRFANVTSLSSGNAAEAVLGQAIFTTSISAAGTTGMSSPLGLAIDSTGRLWVADYGNSRILRFDSAVSKANGAGADAVLGQPDFTSNAPAASATGMSQPTGVAVDSNGVLWVSDNGNSRVLRFNTAASKANGAAADGVLGQPNFTAHVPATSATGLNNSGQLATDNSGRLWVVDFGNNRVLRFDNAASKANGAAADGVFGQFDFISKTPAVGVTGMSQPRSVAVDGGGTLWMSDSGNNRVLRFDHAAAKTNGAADGVLGQPDFISNTGATSALGMAFPGGLTTDAGGNLWVTDAGNNRVLYFANPVRIDTIGIYRSGTFYLRLHNTTGSSDLNAVFNPAGHNVPVIGDWANTGYDTIGVFDQSSGIFALRNSNTAGFPDEQFVFGNINDTPLSGRWFAGAINSGIGVFRPSNGILYVKNTLSNGFSDHAMVLGNAGDQGIAGDWTGHGYEGIGVFRPTGNTFYLVNQVSDGIINSDINFLFGSSTDVAITGDWIAQGNDGIGVFRPTSGSVYLKNALITGVADNGFVYGGTGDLPIAGHWQATYPPVAPSNAAPILIPKTAVPQSTVPGNSAPGGNQLGG